MCVYIHAYITYPHFRDGDTLDMTDYVQVVADESPGHVRYTMLVTRHCQEYMYV